MHAETRYGLLLAVVLVILFSAGNIMGGNSHTVSVFPWLVNLVAFPLVLYPAIRSLRFRLGMALTVPTGREFGRKVVLIAATLFALYSLMFSYFYFAGQSITLLLVVFGMAFLFTVLLGLVCSAICARIVVNQLRRDTTGPGQRG